VVFIVSAQNRRTWDARPKNASLRLAIL